VRRLTYRRTNHENMHVRGYKEEGTITTTSDAELKMLQHVSFRCFQNETNPDNGLDSPAHPLPESCCVA
jgi:phosphoketolase